MALLLPAKRWRKCTAPLGPYVAFKTLQQIDPPLHGICFSRSLWSSQSVFAVGWHSVSTSLPSCCSLFSIFRVPYCSAAGNIMPSCLPVKLGITFSSFFFFLFVYHHVQVEGASDRREKKLTLPRPPIKGSRSVMSPTAAPKTTYCTKWEPLAIQTKT